MPVHAILRHSMIVVLPQPLSPRITVRGWKNSISSSRFGLKLRIPRIESFSMLDILDGVYGWYTIHGV